MAEIKVRMAIDPFRTVGNAFILCQKAKIALDNGFCRLRRERRHSVCKNLSMQKSLIMALLAIKDLLWRL